ncbi:MAG: hypothetical protein LBE33_08360, partial [Zoogloeaceae bacterium]|nr:hypothetical protein [Zoogloeaceae bacterium]
ESDSVLGLRSQLEYIQSSGQQVNWVVHSRGGVEFVQAAGGSSEKNLGNNSVVFHAGANTKPETTQMMDNKRIGDVINRDERYRDSPNDPVAQIIGLRALDNPLNFITSLFATPCVFLCDPENSPHTLPYQWNGLKQQGN